MIWNFIIHSVLGVILYYQVPYNLLNFAYMAFGISFVTQTIDMWRVHKSSWRGIEYVANEGGISAEQQARQSRYWLKLPQMWVMKIIFYGAITLASALAALAIMSSL